MPAAAVLLTELKPPLMAASLASSNGRVADTNLNSPAAVSGDDILESRSFLRQLPFSAGTPQRFWWDEFFIIPILQHRQIHFPKPSIPHAVVSQKFPDEAFPAIHVQWPSKPRPVWLNVPRAWREPRTGHCGPAAAWFCREHQAGKFRVARASIDQFRNHHPYTRQDS